MTATPDLHDTPLPRFEDRLWDELAEAHGQRRDRRPTAVTSHRPHRRRRPLAIGAAVAIAAATTLVVGLAVVPGGEPRPAEASIEDKVVAATDAALDHSVVHSVAHDVSSGDGVDEETWYDHTTGTVRMRQADDQGALLWDNGPAVAPRLADGPPDFHGHDPTELELTDCVPAPADDGQGMGKECQGYDWPDGYPTFVERRVQACDTSYADVEEPFLPPLLSELGLRDEVAAGLWTADGTQVVDGRELIRLRQADIETDLPLPDQTVYVDPGTYLPVEVHSEAGGPDESVVRYEYLPRTAANLNLVSPPVPDGYTQVPELAPCS